jgi:alpha-1,6-mannosyltransferase
VAPLVQSRRGAAAVAAFSTWIMVIFKPDGAHGMYSWPHVLLASAVAFVAWHTLNRPATQEHNG